MSTKQVFQDMRRLAVRLAYQNMPADRSVPVESTRLLAMTVQVSLVPQITTIRELRRELLAMRGTLTDPNFRDDLSVILGQFRQIEFALTG